MINKIIHLYSHLNCFSVTAYIGEKEKKSRLHAIAALTSEPTESEE